LVMLALALPALAGLIAALLGGSWAGIAVAVVVNLAAAVCRLSFESIVARDGPEANRGRAYAQFETRFQLAWVVAAVIPVVLEMPAAVGFMLVGLVMLVALVNYVSGLRSGSTSVAAHTGDP